MQITQHFLIKGRVQGVSFRYFVLRAAQKLQIRGWVRNLVDGRVESIAQGDVASLGEFKNQLQMGPARAEVESIEVRLVEGHTNMKEFSIIEDGVKTWFE